MPAHITSISIENYRAISELSIDLPDVGVFFGPNGAGKSTLLDTFWFWRDCAIRGVDLASEERHHGIGLMSDNAAPGAAIEVKLNTNAIEYAIRVTFSEGRMEPWPGERLYSKGRDKTLIARQSGSKSAYFYHISLNQQMQAELRDLDKLCLERYLDFETNAVEAQHFDRLMHTVHYFHCRSFNFFGLKKFGSADGSAVWLKERAENLWSALRNLKDIMHRDDRYPTIMDFMKRAFTEFDGMEFESTSGGSVYASFLEKGLRNPVKASGVSDGHLHLLILLTALFGEPNDRESLIMFDEPDLSLHPWAHAVLAEAIQTASRDWNRQVLIATHSPSLLAQFEPEQLFAVSKLEGKTHIQPVEKMVSMKDLLESYNAGSLYMAEALAPQSSSALAESSALT